MYRKSVKKHIAFGVLLALGIAAFPLYAGGIELPTASSADLALKANKAGDTYTGAHDFTGAIIRAALAATDTDVVTRIFGDGRFGQLSGLNTWSGSANIFNQAPTLDGFTLGRVLFIATTGGKIGSSSSLFFDTINGFFGINTDTPDSALEVLGGAVTVSEIPAPATPVTNKVTIYAKAGGGVFSKDDLGGESELSADFDALSPLTIKGDTIAFSTVNVRVPVGTDGQVLTADSGETAGVKWAVSGGTKEVVVPAAGNTDLKGDRAVTSLTTNGSAAFTITIPVDFTTLVSLEVLAIPGTTGSGKDIDLFSDYSAPGEAFDANSQSNTTITFAFTTDQLDAFDVSSIADSPGIAAGDTLGIRWVQNSAGSNNIVCLRMRYN